SVSGCPADHKEVDIVQLDSFFAPLAEKLNYGHIFDSGARKTHGLLVMWSKQKFALSSRKTIDLDEPLHSDIRLRMETRNIGLVALFTMINTTPQKHIAVATTHLFWHPAATYERMIQSAKFIDQVMKFTKESKVLADETIFAADFNTEPVDPTYRAMTQRPIELDQTEIQILEESMNYRYKKKLEEECEDEDVDSMDPEVYYQTDVSDLRDKLPRILQIHNSLPCLQSLYGLGYTSVHPGNARKPWGEPPFTNWAKVYRGTLDYIFMTKEKNGNSIKLTGLLRLPEENEMAAEGEPSEGRFASDHLAIMAHVNLR
ncbi:putative RNA exonuclease NGL3, partial [Neolecta irregularis DAH-3]